MKTLIFSLANLIIIFFSINPTTARHTITFRSKNLSSIFFCAPTPKKKKKITSVSDAGVTETLIHDTNLPANVSIVGITIDKINHRIIAVPIIVHINVSFYPFLTDDATTVLPFAYDVAVDFNGNAFVTNSAGKFIWKVNDKGESSIFSTTDAFKKTTLDGFAGRAKLVLLNKNLTDAVGIAVRDNGYVVVVSHQTAWLLKSDSWAEGVVYDETALDWKCGGGQIRIWDGKKKIKKRKFGYMFWLVLDLLFMFWRFQMRHLAKNMSKTA
ncbi:hypothetical protein MKW92_043504 [Papaver armeniacum]|nr:hypothetical protein MKW92_043504 [Papaver armeniacum]